MNKAFFDIETTPGSPGYWAIGALLLNKNYKLFLTADEFCEYLANYSDELKIFVHNLKFEGNFFLSSFTKFFVPVEKKKKDLKNGEFSIAIDIMNNWYSVTLRNKKGRLIYFSDTAKLFPQTLKTLGEMVDVPKLDYDYTKIKNYQTLKEVPQDLLTYLKRDCYILKKVMDEYKDIKWKSTIASTTYFNWKKQYSNEYFYYDFYKPIRSLNMQYLRKWYAGGLCLYSQVDAHQIFKNIYVYDFNSLYPSIMRNEKLPFGKCYDSQPTRHNYLIFYEIEVKNCYSTFIPWIRNTDTRAVLDHSLYSIIYLIGEEYELFKKTYFGQYKILKKYYFKTKYVFTDYIDYWYAKKKKAKINNDKPTYRLSKLMMNSLYGKFGQNNIRQIKYLVKKPKDKYKEWDFQTYGKYWLKHKQLIGKDNYYLPIACAITAYARIKMLNFWLANRAHIVYGDTDSFYSTKDLNINSLELGELKFEGHLYNFQIIRKKHYQWSNDKEDLKPRYQKASGFKGNRIYDITIGEQATHLKFIRTQTGGYLKEVPFTFN